MAVDADRVQRRADFGGDRGDGDEAGKGDGEEEFIWLDVETSLVYGRPDSYSRRRRMMTAEEK